MYQMLVPFQDTPVEVEQNTELPDYLPEDESPTKEQDKAVSRVGSHPEGGASWLSTAANFLSRSFYWWLQFGSKDCVHQQGASFPLWCELSSAICNKLSKGLRLHDCVCCILHFIGHFTPWQRLQVELLCFGFVFFCLIASLCKKCGSVVKPNIYMCSFTFYFTWSTWLGKLVFSSSLRTYLKRSVFFLAQVVHELLNIFLCFSSWKVLDSGTLHWKLKTFLIIPLLCLFNFANHVYRKDITNDTLWIKIYSFECSSSLKIQLCKNFSILFVIILIRCMQSQSRRWKHIYS